MEWRMHRVERFTEEVDELIGENVLWFSHKEKMGSNRIAKRKRLWIDSVNDLEGLNVGGARRK